MLTYTLIIGTARSLYPAWQPQHLPPTTMNRNGLPPISPPVFPFPQWTSLPQRPPIQPPPTQRTKLLPTNSYPTKGSSPPDTKESTLSQNSQEICGQRAPAEVSPLILNGEEAMRGEWPWMVAMYANHMNGVTFLCGASLISAQTVLTAAHCIKTNQKTYEPNDLALQLGRHRLDDWTEIGATGSNIQTIHIHRDFRREEGSFDADIATLIMTRQVEFNQYIRPVCLWPPATDVLDIEGQNATVAGWGKYIADTDVSSVLRKIVLPIVDPLTCIKKSNALINVISQRTFCAGALNGGGPCYGDSGKLV